MNIKGVFEMLEGDADKVLSRFGGNENLWKRFAGKFAEDKTYHQLEESIHAKDYKEAEMHAHTMKGVAANLGFDHLSREAAAIVSAAREEKYEKIPELFEALTKEYGKVLDCVAKLD